MIGMIQNRPPLPHTPSDCTEEFIDHCNDDSFAIKMCLASDCKGRSFRGVWWGVFGDSTRNVQVRGLHVLCKHHDAFDTRWCAGKVRNTGPTVELNGTLTTAQLQVLQPPWLLILFRGEMAMARGAR